MVNRGNTAGMLFPNKHKGMARATQKTGSTNINSFTGGSQGKRSRPQTTGKYPGMPVDPAADFSSNCDTSNRPINSNIDLIVGKPNLRVNAAGRLNSPELSSPGGHQEMMMMQGGSVSHNTIANMQMRAPVSKSQL